MEKSRLSSISKTDSLEKMGEFWDTHDFTDFDTDVPDVDFKISCSIPIELELFSSIESQAQLCGVKIETLVNLWLQQKLNEQTSYRKTETANNGIHPTTQKAARLISGVRLM